jgi:predicted AAA+ superfamily ATPase
MKNISDEIIDILNDELPECLANKVDEFKMQVEKGKYRPAYIILDELKNNKSWSPTAEYLQMIEKFWWTLAN